MLKRNALNSPRLLELKRKRQNAFRNKILFFVFLLILLIIGSVYLSRISGLNIKGVEISGNNVVDTENIKEVVNEKLTGKYLWFFPRTNVLFYPSDKIKTDLYEKFQGLQDINLRINSKGVLEISVSERSAIYTWCGKVPLDAGGVTQKCNFMDKDGYVFDEAPYFSGEVYFKFYGGVLEKPSPIFSQLVLFKENLEKNGLKISSIYVADDGDGKVFLSSAGKSATEGQIRFKTDADLEIVVVNLVTALAAEPLKSEFKNKYSLLSYIDLRFGNKVYYKFK